VFESTETEVDSFQGKESSIIILDFVRSYGLGFLNNRKRINVALKHESMRLLNNFILSLGESEWLKKLADPSEIPESSKLNISCGVPGHTIYLALNFPEFPSDLPTFSTIQILLEIV
jgi:hypothetical protein